MGDDKNIFTGISIISWLMLLITGWMSLGIPSFSILDYEFSIFWLSGYVNKDLVFGNSIDIYYVLLYMIIIITLIFASLAFLVYIYHLFLNKNENVINGMLGNFSKFHFVPLLCISALFIIGESLEKIFNLGQIYDNEEGEEESISYSSYNLYMACGIFFKVKKVHCAFNFIFDIIGLASLIYISFSTKISEPIYAPYIIKGAYSCFIALLVYDFFYTMTLTGVIDKLEDLKGIENIIDNIDNIDNIDDAGVFLKVFDDLFDWLKSSGYASSILIGLINIGLSIFLKDVIISFINLLIYIGMITNFFKFNKKGFFHAFYEESIDFDYYDLIYDGKGIGVIQIILMILSLASIAFVFIRNKPFMPQ